MHKSCYPTSGKTYYEAIPLNSPTAGPVFNKYQSIIYYPEKPCLSLPKILLNVESYKVCIFELILLRKGGTYIKLIVSSIFDLQSCMIQRFHLFEKEQFDQTI